MYNEYEQLLAAVSLMRDLQRQKPTPAVKRELLNTEARVDRLIQDGKEKLNICYPKK